MDFEALESLLESLEAWLKITKSDQLKRQIEALKELYWSMEIGLK